MKTPSIILLLSLLTTIANAIISTTIKDSIATSILIKNKTIPKFPANTTWANQAWGPKSKANELEGQKVINVDLDDTSEDYIKELKDKGHIVSCYISVGTIEYKDRPELYEEFKTQWNEIALSPMKKYPDELWLDITKLNKLSVLMKLRFKKAQKKGCQAIEADNVDFYENVELKNYTKDELKEYQKQYGKWQSKTAHNMGMAIGLKNSMALLNDLVDYYEFAVNEECAEYNECNKYADNFNKQGKAIFGVEYASWMDCKRIYKVWRETGIKIMTKIHFKTKPWENCFESFKSLPGTEYDEKEHEIDFDFDDDENDSDSDDDVHKDGDDIVYRFTSTNTLTPTISEISSSLLSLISTTSSMEPTSGSPESESKSTESATTETVSMLIESTVKGKDNTGACTDLHSYYDFHTTCLLLFLYVTY
eukprot:Pgem_evm1s2167